MVNQLQKFFISHCDIQQLEVNSNQIEIVKKLEQYYKENFQSYFLKLFSKKISKKCFYLYGDVGVGKTMILNFFFEHLKEKKLRLHFNEFMLNFHDFVHEKKEKKRKI